MAFKEHLTVKNIIFVILVLFIIKSLSQITVIALLFFSSYIIACSLNPIVDKLEKKMKRSSAATLVLLGVFTLSFAFFTPIVIVALKQVHGFVTTLPHKIMMIQDFIFNHQFYGYRLPELVNFDSLVSSSSQIATGVVNQSINFTLGFAQGVLFFLAICIIVFYFMADKSVIKDGLIKLFPGEMKDKASKLYDNISTKVGGYVIAQLLNMVIIGILTAIGMFIIKIDYALLLGVITGILDIIPIVGPTIALVLCLLMAYQMGWIKILLVVFVFLLAQWISNNLVRPVIFGRFLNLHPLIIIFALLISAKFLGIWGVILAPAIASLICILFDELYIRTINNKS